MWKFFVVGVAMVRCQVSGVTILCLLVLVTMMGVVTVVVSRASRYNIKMYGST